MTVPGSRLALGLRFSIVSPAAALAAATTIGAPAAASTTYDPSLSRMAVTDRSTAADIQPRIWVQTAGQFLTTKIADITPGSWATVGVGLINGLDAVSWADGTTQRQRVFYVSGPQL